MNTTEIAAILEDVASTEKDWRGIAVRLRKIEQETKDNSLVVFIHAFDYMLVDPNNADYYERYGAFAPIIEMEGKVYPPPIQTISEQDLVRYNDVLSLVNHPLLVSRLSDLLWEIKFNDRPDLFARKAIDCYIKLLDSEINDIEKVEYLRRSLMISRIIRDQETKNKCITEIVNFCQNELASDKNRPGISFRLINALLELPVEETPSIIDDFLNQSFEKYLENPWHTQTNVELLLTRVDEERNKELKVFLVQRWIAEAQKSKGIVKVAHLEHALELARNYGFTELANSIRNLLQNIPESEMGLQEITVSAEIPASEIENFINQFINTETLQQSLIKFGSYGPPSGTLVENKKFVENLSREAPLQFHISNQVLDENHIPIKKADSFEENFELAIIRQEMLGIQIFASAGFEIIDRLNKKFGFTETENLIQFFTTSLIPKEFALSIVKSFTQFFLGEYYLSSLLLIPCIKAIIRNISREVGIPIFCEPVGNKSGRVRGLGELLHKLKDKMDEDWRRYFVNALSDPIGLNYRNRICHGLFLNLEKYDVAVLFHIVCNLRLIEIKYSTNDEKD